MSVNSIECCNICEIFFEDEEEKRIKRRLYFVYGIMPTGNKAIDKERLRQCELKQFQAERVVLSSYITLSVEEQKNMIEKWKEKKIDACQNDPDELERLGAKTKGEQVYLAIQMKKKEEEKQKDKKATESKIITKKMTDKEQD